MILFFFRTFFARRSASNPGSDKDDQRDRQPKVFYCVNFISAHGAPPGNSFGQSVNNPLCDTLPEGILSKASPGQDEIDKPARRPPKMADRTMKGTEC